MAWVATAGLSLMIEANPDTVTAYEPSQQPQPGTGKINLDKVNKSRIPMLLDHLASSSSVSGVATVTTPNIPQITVPGRSSKGTSAPTSSTKVEIATWTAGTTVGASTIQSQFRISSQVSVLGFLLPQCDVITT